MVRLVHEIWVSAEGNEGCVLAGPGGEETRKLWFVANARLLHTFEAGSHLEAMRYYNAYLGREPYVSAYPSEDAAPYPEDWLSEQRGEK
jgi:hypothetical protein